MLYIYIYIYDKIWYYFEISLVVDYLNTDHLSTHLYFMKIILIPMNPDAT